jgi:hypothetical protein
VSITAGGALAGTGTVSGAVTVAASGAVNAGTAGGGTAGRLTLGSLTLQPGSILAFNLTPNGTGVAGTDYSTLAVSGFNLSALSSSNKAVIVLDPAVGGNLLDAPFVQYTWTLVTNTSVVSSFAAGDFTVNNNTFALGAQGGFSLSVVGNSLDLNYVGIPEPSTVALLTGLGALGLVALRRRRTTVAEPLPAPPLGSRPTRSPPQI